MTDWYDEHEAKLLAAMDTLVAVIDSEDSQGPGVYLPRQKALLEALWWLENNTTCGDCIEGRCHWGGEKSRVSIALAIEGQEYIDPDWGQCGCDRHEISVQVRQRRVRWSYGGIISS